jgi:hypothetical protein
MTEKEKQKAEPEQSDENYPDWIKAAYDWARENKRTPNPKPPRSEFILWAAFQQAEWNTRELNDQLEAAEKRIKEFEQALKGTDGKEA